MTESKRKPEQPKRGVGPKNPLQIKVPQRLPMPHDHLIKPVDSPGHPDTRTLESTEELPIWTPGHPDTQEPAADTQEPAADTRTPIGAERAKALNKENQSLTSIQSFPTVDTRTPAADTRFQDITTADTRTPGHPDTRTPEINLNTVVERNWPSRRDKRRLTPRIVEWKVQRLEELALILQCDVQELIEEGIDHILCKYFGIGGDGTVDTRTPEQAGARTPAMAMNNLNVLNKNELLFLYKKLTGAEIKRNDRKHFESIAKIHPMKIEIGIRLAVRRAREADPPRQIYSFGYCLNAINEVENYSPDFDFARKLMELRVIDGDL